MPHKYIGKEYDCYKVPYGLMPCGNVVAGWAVGGGVSKTVLYVLISCGNAVVDRFFLVGYYPTFNDIRYRFKSQVTFQAINQWSIEQHDDAWTDWRDSGCELKIGFIL
jgi:hypothetical protein